MKFSQIGGLYNTSTFKEETKMDNRIITASALTLYRNDLIIREKSTATIDKYSRDLRLFASYLGKTPVSKETVIAFKQHLINSE